MVKPSAAEAVKPPKTPPKPPPSDTLRNSEFTLTRWFPRPLSIQLMQLLHCRLYLWRIRPAASWPSQRPLPPKWIPSFLQNHSTHRLNYRRWVSRRNRRRLLRCTGLFFALSRLACSHPFWRGCCRLDAWSSLKYLSTSPSVPNSRGGVPHLHLHLGHSQRPWMPCETLNGIVNP